MSDVKLVTSLQRRRRWSAGLPFSSYREFGIFLRASLAAILIYLRIESTLKPF